MSDGYEVFDTGHNTWQPERGKLNEQQCRQVLDALRLLRPADKDEARLLLRHASGRRVTSIPELYDVELRPVLDYLAKALRRASRAAPRA